MRDPGLGTIDHPIAGSVLPRAGLDRSEIRADIGLGESAVGRTSPLAIAASQRAFWAAVPHGAINSPAISDRVPSDPAHIQPRDNSSVTTHITSLPSPRLPIPRECRRRRFRARPSAQPDQGSARLRDAIVARWGISASVNLRNWARIGITLFVLKSVGRPPIVRQCRGKLAAAGSVISRENLGTALGERLGCIDNPRSIGRNISF